MCRICRPQKPQLQLQRLVHAFWEACNYRRADMHRSFLTLEWNGSFRSLCNECVCVTNQLIDRSRPKHQQRRLARACSRRMQTGMQFEPVCRRCFGDCSKTESWKKKTIRPKVPTSAARLQIFLIARSTAVWNIPGRCIGNKTCAGSTRELFFSDMIRENNNSCTMDDCPPGN